jgi:integrase
MPRQRPEPLSITRASRFSPTPDGFREFRTELDRDLGRKSRAKYLPIIERLEELRSELFQDAPWSELDDEAIAIDLINALYAECHGRGGGAPSTNTLRGRYDASSAYFEFLRLIRVLERNPLDLRGRPSSKACHKPWLDDTEDKALFELEKTGHEIAVYALARGCGLREEEISALEDSDVDLEAGFVAVRHGKTPRATREVPLFPTAVMPTGAGQAHWRRLSSQESAKLPAEQIAQAGTVIASLGEELAAAEMAPIPEG